MAHLPTARFDPVVEDLGESDILPELAGVPVEGPLFRQATASYEAASARLVAAVDRHDRAVESLGSLGVRAVELDTSITNDEEIKRVADAEVTRLSDRLRHLALRTYVGVSDGEALASELAMDLDRILEGQARQQLSSAISESTTEELTQELAVVEAADGRLHKSRTERTEVSQQISANEKIRNDSIAEAASAREERAQRRVELSDARAVSFVEGTNVPLVALDAYVRGADVASLRFPACQLPWSLLAGIGEVESGQGSFGGARLDASGQVTKPILGMELDGTKGNERIVLSGGGFMRAEGPMQFLPSTWAAVAVDGNDDGVKDIQNIYDAAASAGVLLCRRGHSMTDPGGRRAAILGYNNSGAYVSDVIAAQERYADALPTFPDPPDPD